MIGCVVLRHNAECIKRDGTAAAPAKDISFGLNCKMLHALYDAYVEDFGNVPMEHGKVLIQKHGQPEWLEYTYNSYKWSNYSRQFKYMSKACKTPSARMYQLHRPVATACTK